MPQQDRGIMLRRIRAQGRKARDRIEEGGREAKKRKKPQRSYRRDVENGGDSDRRRKKRRQESLDSVAADLDNLENRRKAWREVQ